MGSLPLLNVLLCFFLLIVYFIYLFIYLFLFLFFFVDCLFNWSTEMAVLT